MSPVTRDGLLVIDKPLGLSSHDVLKRLRWLLKQRSLGHTGTLDPLATGVLCVALGFGCKLIQYLSEDHKVYLATVRFGITTTTDDAEGDVVETRPVSVQADELEAALGNMVGHIEQQPPIYSAIKQGGKRSYARARRGEKVELPPRPVRIDALEVCRVELPDVDIRVVCGRGTYVRSIARDLGATLGCGAYLVGLKRLESGPWTAESAVSLKDIETLLEEETPLPMVMPFEMLQHLPVARLDADDIARLRMGQRVTATSLDSTIPTGSMVRVAPTSEDRLIAVAQLRREGDEAWLQPKRVRPSTEATKTAAETTTSRS